MTEADAIWLAAVIDCEGTLALMKCTRRERRVNGSAAEIVMYSPQLNITNTYLPMIQRCADLTQAKTRIVGRAGRLGSKTCYNVYLHSRGPMLEVLRAVEPFLMEKRELARRLIDWMVWFEANRASSAGLHRSPQDKRLARGEYDAMALHVRQSMAWGGVARERAAV